MSSAYGCVSRRGVAGVRRAREFDQLETQWFCTPASAPEWYRYWVDYCHNWLLSIGIRPENLRRHEYDASVRAMLSAATLLT